MLEIQLSGTCPGTYDNAKSNYITSPNYPNYLKFHVNCEWSITVLVKKHIVLSFVESTIGRYDELIIYEGNHVIGKVKEPLYKYYGDSLPSKKWIDAKSVYMTFTRHSSGYDSSTARNRFKIRLQASGQ